ncbi:MBL fold metallo-hydrolase [Candidatus Bipolaricaulota bacterium]|nr:MBL fold metallo-hydrolase [Candidatus Bipolaricaulota bacterium]
MEVRVEEIWDETYLINTYNDRIDLTFNQYVINDDWPMLVHAGSAQQFDSVTNGLKRVCLIEDLEYILISHFESDECGALSRFLDRNPDLSPVCSEITARQLCGFDIHQDPVVKEGGDTLDLGSRTLKFLNYPAEMHLWNGILAYDSDDDGLFSSDLFIRRGPVDELVVAEDIALESISPDRIPNQEEYRMMVDRLIELSPRWIAPGHGPVLERRA